MFRVLLDAASQPGLGALDSALAQLSDVSDLLIADSPESGVLLQVPTIRQIAFQITELNAEISRQRASADLEQQVQELQKHLSAGTCGGTRIYAAALRLPLPLPHIVCMHASSCACAKGVPACVWLMWLALHVQAAALLRAARATGGHLAATHARPRAGALSDAAWCCVRLQKLARDSVEALTAQERSSSGGGGDAANNAAGEAEGTADVPAADAEGAVGPLTGESVAMLQDAAEQCTLRLKQVGCCAACALACARTHRRCLQAGCRRATRRMPLPGMRRPRHG